MDEKAFDSINVIPLVDVMLVLLTIVLTTSTFIATGIIPLELPKAENSEQAEQLQPLIIALNRDGQIFLESDLLPLKLLRTALAKHERTSAILIRADKSVALQSFVEVMDLVKGLGFKKVSLQTETS